nr:reverse transcriptase domain-containing protein [Tanacetum cinerariifolium]
CFENNENADGGKMKKMIWALSLKSWTKLDGHHKTQWDLQRGTYRGSGNGCGLLPRGFLGFCCGKRGEGKVYVNLAGRKSAQCRAQCFERGRVKRISYNCYFTLLFPVVGKVLRCQSLVGIRRVVPRNYNPKGERFLIVSRFPTPPLACAFFSLRATETSSSKLTRDQTSNPISSANPTPKGQIHRSSKQKVENSHFEEHLTPVATMTDNRTMAEMLRAPTEGWAAHRWLEKEPPRSITTWDDLVSKFINEFFPPSRTTNLRNEILKFQQKFDESFHQACERYKDLLRACPHHSFTELHQLETFYNALNAADQDSLIVAACGNLLEKSPQDALTIIENISKQTSTVTTAMMAMIKQFPSNPPPAQVKVVKKICFTYGGAHPYYQCLAAGGNTFLEFRGLVTEGPTVPNPPKSVNPEEDECVEETYTDPQEKDDIQIQKFWNMFKQLHLNITLAEALVLMPKYQKMLKALLSNKEKHQELANTPLNENCSAIILKKLPKKLRDPGKFLIPCVFSELKCKALADLGASINLMPLSVWKKLGLPDLILTRMTLELANRAIYTPDGIARDVFIPVGKFTFPADFVVVEYESDPRVPLILGRPFLRTARALIDVHGKELILRDGDERLTLNMKHDTASYSNHPHRESVNLINIFNLSIEDYLEDLVSHKESGNPTFSLHKEIASPEVIHVIHDSKGCNFLSEELPDIDYFNDIHPHFDDDPLSGSTAYLANSLLEEFTDELALITYPSDYDDNRTCDIESDLKEIEFLLYQGKYSDLKDSIDQSDLANLDDLFVDPTPEMFTDEQPPNYSFPLRFDVDDDLPSPDNEDKDFDPPIYELLVFKEVPNSMRLLPFSSENEEKVFKPGIYTSKKVHSCFLLELSHPGEFGLGLRP